MLRWLLACSGLFHSTVGRFEEFRGQNKRKLLPVAENGTKTKNSVNKTQESDNGTDKKTERKIVIGFLQETTVGRMGKLSLTLLLRGNLNSDPKQHHNTNYVNSKT